MHDKSVVERVSAAGAEASDSLGLLVLEFACFSRLERRPGGNESLDTAA